MERKVKVAAVNKRYQKGEVFYAIPYLDPGIDNYVTGQEKRIGNKDGLTKDQIEGKRELNDKQREKYSFPIIMDPETFRGLPISRTTVFNLGKDDDGNYFNPSDVDRYNFFVDGQREIIAEDKAGVKVDKHLFYFIDEEKEASVRVKNRRGVFDVMKQALDNLTPASYYELFLTVNFNSQASYNTAETRKSILEDNIYDACEKYPEIVKRHFTKDGQEEMFVLKLMYHQLLNFSDGAFSDKKGKYIGNSPREVLNYLSKKGNHITAASWRKSLMQKDALFAQKVEAEAKENEDKDDKTS